MHALNARKRVLVCRLTQDEYDSLKGACAERGARNLSEFTRAELLDAVHSSSLDDIIRERFSEVERRLDNLQTTVAEIHDRIRGCNS